MVRTEGRTHPELCRSKAFVLHDTEHSSNTVLKFLLCCSGPKRYDWSGERWLYYHDGVSLHQLLSQEFSLIFKRNINLLDLPHS